MKKPIDHGNVGRPMAPHGASLQNSKYASYLVMWLGREPRLAAYTIRKRLVDQFGSDAKFSEPTVKGWLTNYYPELLRRVRETMSAETENALIGANDSRLFGKVPDALTYHIRMRMELENKLISLKEDYERLERDIKGLDRRNPVEDDADNPDESVQLRMQVIKTRVQISAKIKDISKEIREYSSYIDEFQRFHDIGARLGDLLESLVNSVYEHVFPYVVDDRKNDVRAAFDEAWKAAGISFGVPATKIMA